MRKNLVGILEFLVILATYIMVLIALVPFLPLVLLTVLLVWLVVRRPIAHPERMDSDVEVLRTKAGAVVAKLVETLVHPLTHRP